MTFKLFCRGDPVTLGVQDDEGNWHMERYLSHVRTCDLCETFIDILGDDILDTFFDSIEKEKGGLADDRL